jgi:signal transduction histidine kinase
LNLISNAIKFTKNGTITIRFAGIPFDEPNQILIKVKDTGIGIPKDKIEGLFKEFS